MYLFKANIIMANNNLGLVLLIFFIIICRLFKNYSLKNESIMSISPNIIAPKLMIAALQNLHVHAGLEIRLMFWSDIART